jgi:pimeloyl-ACP methyl ester carboxylesterase
MAQREMAAAAQARPQNSTTVRPDSTVIRAARMSFRVLSPHTPALAARWAEELFLTPRRRPRPHRERELLAGAVRARARYGEATLPLWIWNPDASETVVLVHGWEGRGAQLGAFVAPLVERGLRVVTFDAPGHGDAPLRRASVVEHARALLAVVERLGGEVHAVIGHSVGGAAALLATRLGLRAKRLALVAPPTSPARFAAGFARILGIDARVHAGMLLRLERRYGIAVADLDVRRDSASFGGELLVVHDEDDRVVPWSDGAAIASAAKNARLVTTRGLGHGRVLEAPAVVDEVTAFAADGARPRAFTETLEGELFCRDTRYVARAPVSRR